MMTLVICKSWALVKCCHQHVVNISDKLLFKVVCSTSCVVENNIMRHLHTCNSRREKDPVVDDQLSYKLPSYVVDDNKRCLVGIAGVEVLDNFGSAAIPRTIVQ